MYVLYFLLAQLKCEHIVAILKTTWHFVYKTYIYADWQ